jgi:hypothetical protein
VTAVDSAAAAREALRRSPPDLLVSDIGMPGEDGYSLIRSIREQEAAEAAGRHGKGRSAIRRTNRHPLPAVALTAYSAPDDRARALAAGFQAHAPKPVQPEELIELLTGLVGKTNGTKRRNR